MLPDPGFAVFKYKHDAPLVSSWVVWALFWALFAVVGLVFFFLGPVGFVVGVVVVIVLFQLAPKRQISLGPRFVVCGDRVAYYKNVRRMVLRPGHLTLFWGNKQTLVVEQERFPTNARKSHKISANKAQKFAKVSYKIIDRVLAESPSVETVGIDRKTKQWESP